MAAEPGARAGAGGPEVAGDPLPGIGSTLKVMTEGGAEFARDGPGGLQAIWLQKNDLITITGVTAAYSLGTSGARTNIHITLDMVKRKVVDKSRKRRSSASRRVQRRRRMSRRRKN